MTTPTFKREGKDMKYLNKKNPTFILFITSMVFILIFSIPVKAGQFSINLGKAESFTVLAGCRITNIGTTTINGNDAGDIGLSPGNYIDEGIILVSGYEHLNDTKAIEAKVDLDAAYEAASNRKKITIIDSELGGQTLIPGTYASINGTFIINGTLTLDSGGDPEGIFVFQTTSTLITAPDSSINLINNAQFYKVFWKVGTSATLGYNSIFVGQLLAMITITAQTGATIQGQLLARVGAVNLDNNSITNDLYPIETVIATGVKNATTTSVDVVAESSSTLYDYLLFGLYFTILGGLSLFIFKK